MFRVLKTVCAAVIGLSVAACQNAVAQQAAPIQYAGNGHYYHYIEENLSWTDARTTAAGLTRFGNRGHLATIANAGENAFIAGLRQFNSDGNLHAWIGYTDEADEGTFEWITGEPTTFTSWNPGEPNNVENNEHHVEITASGNWNDNKNSIDYKHGFVVEFDSTKHPVPDDVALQEVAELIQEVYEEDFSKAEKPSEIVALARKFLNEGLATTDDPNGQYGLFRAAKGLAIGVGDAGTALQAVDEIYKLFDINALAMKVKVLESAGEAAMPADRRKQLVLAADGIIDVAIADDNYEAATKLASVAVVAARKSRDFRLVKEAVNRVIQVEALHAEYQKVKQAMDVLENDLINPEANLTVGKFQCYVKGDWSMGLPMLALGSDPVLKDLAEQELIEPDTPHARMKLGDRWWDLADQQDEPAKRRIQERAAHWYTTASRGLTGLAKAKVNKRLADLLPSAFPSPNRTTSPGISFAEAKRLIARLDRLDEERWAVLQGKEVIVPADPRRLTDTGIIVEKNERYLVIPCPADKWNTSPNRWTDVDFRGHLGEGARARNGMPYMQLCYSLDAAPLVSVVDNYIIRGSGKLFLAPSDREGGGTSSNNTGRVRAKIIKIVK